MVAARDWRGNARPARHNRAKLCLFHRVSPGAFTIFNRLGVCGFVLGYACPRLIYFSTMAVVHCTFIDCLRNPVALRAIAVQLPRLTTTIESLESTLLKAGVAQW